MSEKSVEEMREEIKLIQELFSLNLEVKNQRIRELEAKLAQYEGHITNPVYNGYHWVV